MQVADDGGPAAVKAGGQVPEHGVEAGDLQGGVAPPHKQSGCQNDQRRQKPPPVPAAVRTMFCHRRGPLSRQCENCEKDACNNQPYYSIGSIPKAREKMYKEQGKSEGNPMDSP